MAPLLIGGIIETVGKIASDLITTDKERAELEIGAYRAETERLGGQTEINKVEAASQNLWVSGWRPAVGWCGVLAMFYQFFLYPIMVWGWTLMQSNGWISLGLLAPPILDTDALWVILTGILGIGGMRTVDKIKGVATK